MPKDTRAIVDELYALIVERRRNPPAGSYVAKLSAEGGARIAQKVGEEAIETVIAATRGEPDRVIAESADLIFHLLVLWAEQGVTPDEIWAELRRRQGRSGLAEKAARDADTK